MKNYLLVFGIITFTFLSCEKNQEEIKAFNSYLKANYEFNTKTLNIQKGEYYIRASEKIEFHNEKLNELDTKFEVLITDVEKAISSKETNIEHIIARYEEILNEIPQITNHNKEYLIKELGVGIYDKTNTIEFRLNIFKNKLVMSMYYAFEYINKPTFIACGFRRIESANTEIKHNTDKNVTVTLSSDVIQLEKENRQIIVNSIHHNGRKTETNHFINDNYAFADITLDSLQKGNYKLIGVVRYYLRSGKIDIPFEESFKVD